MTISEVVHRAAMHGLSTGGLPLIVTDVDVTQLMDAAAKHRVFGLLAAAIDDGAIGVSDECWERVADFQQSWTRHVLLVERLLLDLGECLETTGIEYRVLKGAALAHTVYSDPAQRLYNDADLLVRGEDLDRAVATAVDELGASTLLAPIRQGFDREFGKSTTVRRGPVEIDIHRTLADGPFGLMLPLEDVFERSSRFEFGDRSFPCLAPTEQFVHVCVNSALGDRPPRLMAMRDVAATWPHVPGGVAAVDELAHRWRCVAPVQHAIIQTWAELALDPCELSDWADNVRPPLVERLMMRSYLTDARSYSRPLAAAAAIPGLRPRLRYLGALMRPQREYLQARGWTRGDHMRRALRAFGGRK